MRKCIICGKKAEFIIKNSSEAYCAVCAEEHFSDISYLQKIEEEAKKLESFVEKQIKN
jgi:hypothetical protein